MDDANQRNDERCIVRKDLDDLDRTNGDGTGRTPLAEEATNSCQRCGRDRPADARRLVVAFTDRTDATIQDERVFLCGDCWSHLRDMSRRCLA